LATYIARRILQAILMVFLLSIVQFALVNLAPGGPLAGQGQTRHVPPEQVDRLKRQFGLDKPLPEQYIIWLIGNDWMKVDRNGDGIAESYGTRKGILRGDFGFSFRTRKPVLEEIAQRLPNTIYLMSITLLVALVIAIPIGVISAVRQYSAFDIAVTTFSFAGQAIPEFWLGLILILVFYGILRNPFTGEALLPSGGLSSLDVGFSLVGARLGGLVFALPAFQHAGCHQPGLPAHGACKRIVGAQGDLQTWFAQRPDPPGDFVCFGPALYLWRDRFC
jgi:peptide/nickel transport system permease protein